MAKDEGQAPSDGLQEGIAQAAGSQDPRIIVQNAFKLGWHVAELFHFDKVGPEARSHAPGGEAATPATPARTSGHRPPKDKPEVSAAVQTPTPPADTPPPPATVAEATAG